MADEKKPEAAVVRAQRREWRRHLDESNAWQWLIEGSDVTITGDEIAGETTDPERNPARLARNASTILSAHGFRVVVLETFPRLKLRVEEEVY